MENDNKSIFGVNIRENIATIAKIESNNLSGIDNNTNDFIKKQLELEYLDKLINYSSEHTDENEKNDPYSEETFAEDLKIYLLKEYIDIFRSTTENTENGIKSENTNNIDALDSVIKILSTSLDLDLNPNTKVVKNFIKSNQFNDIEDINFLLTNLRKFDSINQKELAKYMIKNELGWIVAKHIVNFNEHDREKIIKYLIKDDYDGSLVESLLDFNELDIKKFTKYVIKNKLGFIVAEHLKDIAGIDHNKIAKALIEEDDAEYVAINLENFSGLNKKIAKALIEEDYISCVEENQGSFKGLEYKGDNIDLIRDQVNIATDKIVSLTNCDYAKREQIRESLWNCVLLGRI